MIENQDYELIPEGEDLWRIRLLETDFPETVFEFFALKLIEDNQLSFNFKLISSPDESLTEDNVDLQQTVGMVLRSILDGIYEREQGKNVDKH